MHDYREKKDPKYIRNPVTGLYEKVVDSNPSNPSSRFPFQKNNSITIDNNLYTPLGKDFSSPQATQMEELNEEKLKFAQSVSYDDMLKNLDHLVENQSPKQVSKSPLDFNALSDSLDSLIKSASPITPNLKSNQDPLVYSLGSSSLSSPLLQERQFEVVQESYKGKEIVKQSRNSPKIQQKSFVISERSNSIPDLNEYKEYKDSNQFIDSKESIKESKESINNSIKDSKQVKPPNLHVDLDELETKQKRKDWEKEKRDKMILEMREAKVISEQREKVALQERNRNQNKGIENTKWRSNGPLGSFIENNDDSQLALDYIKAIMSALRSDPTVSPIPEDFTSPDGFYYWQQSVNMRLQDVLIEILKSKYIETSESQARKDPKRLLPLKITLKIVQARGLLTKEGRNRNPYCVIECGNLEKKKEKQVFSTEILQSTLSPVWNQHLDISVQSMQEKINIEVWDKLKEQFLGRIWLNMPTLLSSLESEGRLAGWYRLESRSSKYKDKYVGGEIYLDISSEILVCFFLIFF